jgi:sugar phosphate isomerase/epimerase
VEELLEVLKCKVSSVAASLYFPISAGLYLSQRVVDELIVSPSSLENLRAVLHENGLYVCSLNCFPYGSFHHRVIKEAVYFPDWGSRERVEYTKRAGVVLDFLLPDGVVGSISTVPITYGKDLPSLAMEHLEEVLVFFATELRTTIYLALEPEPDCYLDDTTSCLAFFRMCREVLSSAAYRQLGLCFDTCHFSVIFEDPNESYRVLKSQGIRIPKIQVSSSLVTSTPQKLTDFAEPIYLHQTAVLENNHVSRFKDLDKALFEPYFIDAEWRVHFHIPIYLAFTKEGLGTTQKELKLFLNRLELEDQVHLEVETYSLGVIPGVSISAVESTVLELEFLVRNLKKERAEDE